MTNQDLQQLKYPIGPFQPAKTIETKHLEKWIHEIETFPSRLKEMTQFLNMEKLQWKYRPDGWTIQQIIHHCADSHTNAFFRFKLALTEDNPTIRPYNENAWAQLADVQEVPISYSQMIIEGIHTRWLALLKKMSPEDFKKTFFHPEHQKTFTLDVNLGLYAWHGSHHLAHIQQAKVFAGKY